MAHLPFSAVLSPLVLTPTAQMPPCQHNVLNDQLSPSINPATLPLPPSPCTTPSAPVVRPEESAWRADPTVGPGELDGTARSTPKLGTPTAAPRESKASVEPTSVEPTAASLSEPVSCDTPSITFEDLARRYRQSHRKRIQRQRLESRLRTAKVSTGVLSRMIRVGNTVQRGLIETLKHEDKSNFVSLYQTLLDLRESCDFTARADEQADWSDESSPSLDAGRHSSMDFLHQLSPQSRTDLLDILHRVRSDPQFLVNRLRSFTSAQLATFISPASSLDFGDPAFPSSFSTATSSSSRVRGQYSMNRISTTSASFKNYVYAFERTDPLTILFCNVFTAQLDSESAESRLRLDVWSTVCAQLISQGSSKFYPLVGQVLSSITHGIWKARPQFELYLMDILQRGAFLLEHTASPAGLDFTPEALDPLRTDVAEEFFASAVDGLFRVLDDPDCGFPSAVFQFAREVLGRLDSPDSRSRFLEYLFVQWFFPKFLYSALTYPEAHGLLLDFHIRKDAREKLLGQVGLRAYSQIYAVLRSMFVTLCPSLQSNSHLSNPHRHHVSVLRPSIKAHVDNMLSRFYVNHSSQPSSAKVSCETESSADCAHRDDSTPNFLLLSSADVVTLLDALFPTPGSPVDPTPGFTGASMHKATNGLRSATSTGNTFAKTALGRIAHGNSSHMARSEDQISQAAARVRFELSDLDERHGRVTMDHPAEENWTILSVASEDSALASTITPSYSRMSSDRDSSFDYHGQAEGDEALHNAVIRLINEDHCHQAGEVNQDALEPKIALATLRGRFNRAMFSAQNNSDFVNAHYWWNLTRQLRRQSLSDGSNSDAWILEPMHKRCMRSLEKSIDVIDRCEMELLFIDQSLHRLHAQVKSLMAVVTKIRIKMWYMTEVKNSMRYEEARHVTTALTMIPTARPQTTDLPEYSRSRFGTRSLGSSLFQKPEVQVLKMMTAPCSQGGPRKLSDEQVDLTRKWLAHSNIENFCKGEERIHRFCYEVRISVNRLVGETMAEAPILWASDLFQRERVSYEGHAGRAFPGLSIPTTPRPSTGASDDHLHSHHLFGSNLSVSDAYNRPPDLSPLIGRKPSIQSFLSDSYRANRDLPSFEVSSMGGSPSRAASTTTTTTSDNHSSFWSAHQGPSTYAASVSTAYSRPPSMISDGAMRQPRRAERKVQGKDEFIEDLRQHLTSLLLSDLGSPVWSCGSETDAWFARYLSHPPVKAQMQKQASFQKFYSDYEKRSHFEKQRQSSGARRSRSLDRSWRFTQKGPSADVSRHLRGGSDKDGFPGFSYEDAFRRLLDTFSRHGNPLVKLNALRDLRSMVIASLVPVQENDSTIRRATKAGQGNGRGSKTFSRACTGRRSFTDLDIPSLLQADTTIPAMAPAASLPFGSTRSTHDVPAEEKIVATLRKLILDVKPKTLFRDLQYISAFVPTEYFAKSDRETAFLQFGLAALSLKEEACHGMVEVADRIVSQELLRRHPLPGAGFHSRPVHAIDDAAEMWIITAKEGNPIAQRELAILYLTHPERLQRVTLPLTRPRDTFKAEMMYRRDKDSKSDPQSMCLALHWMQLSANGGDILARNRLREREEFDSIA